MESASASGGDGGAGGDGFVGGAGFGGRFGVGIPRYSAGADVSNGNELHSLCL